jgi:hypothetical protein
MILHTTVPEQYMTCAGMNHLQYQVPRQSTQYSILRRTSVSSLHDSTGELPTQEVRSRHDSFGVQPRSRDGLKTLCLSHFPDHVSPLLELLRTVRWLSDRLAAIWTVYYVVDYLDENAATIASRRWIVRLVRWSLLRATLQRPQTGLVNLLICRLVGQLPSTSSRP